MWSNPFAESCTFPSCKPAVELGQLAVSCLLLQGEAAACAQRCVSEEQGVLSSDLNGDVKPTPAEQRLAILHLPN